MAQIHLALTATHCIDDVREITPLFDFGIVYDDRSTDLIERLSHKRDLAFGKIVYTSNLFQLPQVISLETIKTYVDQKKEVSFYGMGGSNLWFYSIIGEIVDSGRDDVGFFSAATPRKVNCHLDNLKNEYSLMIKCHNDKIRNGDSGAVVITKDNEVIGIISSIYGNYKGLVAIESL